MNRSHSSVMPFSRMLVFFGSLLLQCGTTHANLITYQISGLVTDIIGDQAGTVTSISVGDTWSFFARIDASTADTVGGNPLAGIYPFASMAGNLTFDSSVIVPVPAGGSQSAQVEVRDNTDIPDRLEFNSFGANTVTIDGLMLGRWDIILSESTATLFSTDALAESINRDVTDFDTRSFQLNLSVGADPRDGQATINGSVTAFSAVVPLPGALWLFGSGLLGLIGISRHNKAV